jgi:hypothetical protein
MTMTLTTTHSCRRARRMLAALGLGAGLLLAPAAPAMAAVEPAANGPDALVARFTGGPRGIVVAVREGGDSFGLRAAFIGLDRNATYRLVLATSSCGQPAQDPVVAATFNTKGEPEKYLARDITSFFPTGLLSRVSARLRQVPGGPVGCANTTLYALGPSAAGTTSPASSGVASFLEAQVAWFKTAGARGLAVVGLIDGDSARVQAMVLDTAPGVRHRLLGSGEPCSKGHGATDTVFSTRASRWVNERFDGVSNLGLLLSVRVFRGSGLSNQVACGDQVSVLAP